MTKDQLKDYLVYEAEYDQETVDNMDDYELLNAYLNYEGVVGFTNSIVSVIKALDIENL